MRLGSIGVWLGAFTVASAAEARPAAREIEELGYDTLWYPEGLGTRESFSNGAVRADERVLVEGVEVRAHGRDGSRVAVPARVDLHWVAHAEAEQEAVGERVGEHARGVRGRDGVARPDVRDPRRDAKALGRP